MESFFLYWILLILLVATYIKQGVLQNMVILSSTNKTVLENSSVALTCSNKSGVLLESRWSSSMYEELAVCALVGNTCLKTRFLNTSALLNCSCNLDGTYTVILKHVDRFQHGVSWRCGQRSIESNTVVINVSVPVARLKLTYTYQDFIAENHTSHFRCKSSFSRPKPTIDWFLSNGTSDFQVDKRLVANINESAVNKTVGNRTNNILTSTKSDLTLKVQRSMNKQQIYCLTNDTSGNVVRSDMQTLNVSYPPDTPVIKINLSGNSLEAIDVISVIENTNILLECSAESKPNSTFTWSRSMNENTNEVSKQLMINHIQRNQSGTYTCHAQNVMVRSFGDIEIGRSNRSIYFGVLYPPDTPTFYYLENGNRQKINTIPLKVVVRDNVNVLCNATGNPKPSSVWIDTGAETDTLSIVSVDIQHQTNITCKSSNMMHATFGLSRNGTSLKNLHITVLYPPRDPVIHIQMKQDLRKEALNFTCILEGSDFRLYCYSVSNPPPSYKWIGPVHSGPISSSAELFVSNIQRNQSGPYICYAQNNIERSFGINETGRNNRSIYFNILYKAAIKYFGAIDFENDKNMITISQREKTQILCNVESNPFPNGTIIFKGRLVNETIRGDIVTYNIKKSKCSDAGRYICKGKNEYNYDKDATKEFILYVKCPPKPSADQPPENNVSAALSKTAVFSFHAAPYYDPGITEFRWFKQGNGSRILLRNGTKTYISSSDIHSALRIIGVSEDDYGMYLLLYNNSFGINNFTFYLHERGQTVSTDIAQVKDDNNNLPVVLGIVVAVLITVGITFGILLYKKRYTLKTDNGNGDGSYENVSGMNEKFERNAAINRDPVYEGLKPNDERGFVEMKEQAYDLLQPKGSPDTKDPVYTNLKL